MGASSSAPAEQAGGSTDGYHVLKVSSNSPGSKAGLVPFFDYIVSANGTRLVRGRRGPFPRLIRYCTI